MGGACPEGAASPPLASLSPVTAAELDPWSPVDKPPGMNLTKRCTRPANGSCRGRDLRLLQALTNKQTITALTETLEDAVTMGADQTELAEGIRKRLEQGRAWDDTAARFLAAPGRPPISALEVRSPSAAGRTLFQQLAATNQCCMSGLEAWQCCCSRPRVG